MRLVIICVGKVRAPFADDVAHYERLIARHARLESVELAEAANPAGEAEPVIKRIPAGAHVSVLDRDGEQLSSEEFSRFLEERRTSRADLCFVVGGPQGLDPSVVERADRRLAFGRATLPHQLARVVLLEQLFRAHKIMAGEPYHY